jgi:hypothetical protein
VWGSDVVHVREFGVGHEEDMQMVGVDSVAYYKVARDRRENWKCCDS